MWYKKSCRTDAAFPLPDFGMNITAGHGTECKSVKNKIDTLTKILQKYYAGDEKIQSIINDYLLELIPAGTKGVIRGIKFNNIVRKNIF